MQLAWATGYSDAQEQQPQYLFYIKRVYISGIRVVPSNLATLCYALVRHLARHLARLRGSPILVVSQ